MSHTVKHVACPPASHVALAPNSASSFAPRAGPKPALPAAIAKGDVLHVGNGGPENEILRESLSSSRAAHRRPGHALLLLVGDAFLRRCLHAKPRRSLELE